MKAASIALLAALAALVGLGTWHVLDSFANFVLENLDG